MKSDIWRQTPASVKLLYITSFIMNLGFYALIPYLTLHLTGSIGWTLAMAGLVLGVRQFSQQGFAFLGGMVADKFGYKSTMILGMSIRAIGFALFAFCTKEWHFFVAAILSGLGGSLFEPAGSAAYAVLTPDAIRKEVFAFRNVLQNVGVVGSQIVGTALASLDFYWLSLFAGALYATTAVVAFLFLPPIAATNTKQGIWSSFSHVLHDQFFLKYTIVLIGYYYLYMQTFLTIPQLVEDIMHNKTYVGIVLSTISLSVILLQMKIVEWLQSYKQRLILIGIGAMVMGIGLFLLMFANHLWLLMLDAFIFSLGTMISMPQIVDMVPRFAPKEHVAAYYGFNGYSLAIGGTVSQLFGGWIYDVGKNLDMQWLPWTLCLLVGMVVVWNLYRMEGKLEQQLSPSRVK
ncbi:MDR family MFS transporter [Brevibacillus fulvus]|uniref:DHA1 family multidrug resistance protein-like MFS transporter n=1 Tax=Brevibacillus fulvus TaxID=1125967 RepID=A0A938XVL4_9BACL|nr:MFS transporter [Brevibacillus fulvus]MBM7588523.1 DHA1 family multidrug resistance protein-like MFS transporter [Brevibacillus fulvus]